MGPWDTLQATHWYLHVLEECHLGPCATAEGAVSFRLLVAEEARGRGDQDKDEPLQN